jgi:CrcB protein
MWTNIVLVAVGGAVGSALRYLTAVWIGPQETFPWGTWTANVLGCFLIGFFTARWPENAEYRYLLVTGFCGGYTTFSTFALEAQGLWDRQIPLGALLYVLASVVAGWLAVWAGRMAG